MLDKTHSIALALCISSPHLASAQQLENLRFLAPNGNVLWTEQSTEPLSIFLHGRVEGDLQFYSDIEDDGAFQIAPAVLAWRLADSQNHSQSWGALDKHWFGVGEGETVAITGYDPSTGLVDAEFSIPIGGYDGFGEPIANFAFEDNVVEIAVGWAGTMTLGDPTGNGLPLNALHLAAGAVPGALEPGHVLHWAPGSDLLAHEPTEFSLSIQGTALADTDVSLSVFPRNSALLPGEQILDGGIIKPVGGTRITLVAGTNGVDFSVTPLISGPIVIKAEMPNGDKFESQSYYVFGGDSPGPGIDFTFGASLGDTAGEPISEPDFYDTELHTRCNPATSGYGGDSWSLPRRNPQGLRRMR
jgi:hypothetical protein